MIAKVTLWLFKALFYSALGCTVPRLFPCLDSISCKQTEEAASTLPQATQRLSLQQSGDLMSFLRQDRPWHQDIPAWLVAEWTRQCVFGKGRVLEHLFLMPCPWKTETKSSSVVLSWLGSHLGYAHANANTCAERSGLTT